MARNKSTARPLKGNRRKKRSDKVALIWKEREWTVKKDVFEKKVFILANRTNARQLVVKKVLKTSSISSDDKRPPEIRALSILPSCSRVVKHLVYSTGPTPGFGTAIFEYFPRGDLASWKKANFDNKQFKAVPESYIWRFFVQMSQAMAFLQNKLGPSRGEREAMIHRDIKPMNILVVASGSTYPSFKLCDFGCAIIYQKQKASIPARCGTFEWQPPENPIINTEAADLWSLGAIVHWLAVYRPPLENISYCSIMRWTDEDPMSADDYRSPVHYYAARVPRRVTPINLDKTEQVTQRIAPYREAGRPSYNHRYSNELNDWMLECLSLDPTQRPGAEYLVNEMIPMARVILKQMGGTPALTDLEVKF